MTHAEKLAKTMIQRYGSEEAWREAQAKYGRLGGKKSKKGGFAAMDKKKLKTVSRKGGLARHGLV